MKMGLYGILKFYQMQPGIGGVIFFKVSDSTEDRKAKLVKPAWSRKLREEHYHEKMGEIKVKTNIYMKGKTRTK